MALKHHLFFRNTRELYCLLLLGSLLLVFLYKGGVESALSHVPADDRTFVIFFKELFFPFLILMLAWFLALVKENPYRVREFFWLTSLPLCSTKLSLHLLFRAFFATLWVWFFTLLLIKGLYFVTPPPYLCRLVLIMLLVYLLVLELHQLLHLYLSRYTAFSASFAFPACHHPLVALVAALLYLSVLFTAIVVPFWLSGQAFWIALSVVLILIVAGFLLYRRGLSRWLFLLPFRFENMKPGWIKLIHLLRSRLHLPPLLFKKSCRMIRRMSGGMLGLSSGFILLTWLISHNNEQLGDALDVIYYLSMAFAVFIAFRIFHFNRASIESPQFFYAMPLRHKALYISIWLPWALWSALVFLPTGILVFVSKQAPLMQALPCYAQTWLGAQVWLLAAVNFVLVYYPDMKTAQKQYTYWMLVLVVLFALFYPYRHAVAMLLLFLSFVPLRRVSFYFTT